MQKCKQKVTKVVSLIKNSRKSESVSKPFKSAYVLCWPGPLLNAEDFFPLWSNS